MTDHHHYDDDPVSRLLFAPESAWPLAIVRILIGAVLACVAVALMFDVSPLLSQDGMVPSELGSGLWRPIGLETERSVWIAVVALLAVAFPIIAGYRPTIFLLIGFVLLTSLQRRNPMITNSGDQILRNLLLLLALTPSSAALSIDRWRTHGRQALVTAPLIAPWGLRLIQLQIMVVYFIAFWGKRGDLWAQGTAVATAFRITNVQRFASPDWLIESVSIVALLTWGTLAVELALAMFLWNRRFRPTLIVLGVTLHVFIDVFMLIGFFGPSMIAGLMCFLDGDRVQRRVMTRFGPEPPDGPRSTAPRPETFIERAVP